MSAYSRSPAASRASAPVVEDVRPHGLSRADGPDVPDVGFDRHTAFSAASAVADAGYDLVSGVDVLLSGGDQLVEPLGPVESQLQEPLRSLVRASDGNGRCYVCGPAQG